MMYQQNKTQGYEVSSIGDARFSALFAKLGDGRTIEMHYQLDEEHKGYNPLGTNWRAGKGKPPSDRSKTPEILYDGYLQLWRQWANDNPELIEELKIAADKHGGFLKDSYATGGVNQARALAQILNEKFK